MRTSVFILFLSALVAVGCSKASDSKPSGTSDAADKFQKRTVRAEESKIEFVVTKKPKGKYDGGFKSIGVNINPFPTNDNDLVKCKIDVGIDTYSLWADDPKLAALLKSPDVLDVAKYPKVTFVSSRIEAEKSGENTHKITGDMTVHGKTKTITVPAKVAVTPEVVTITSHFKINRHDFDISYGKGQIDDDVTIKAELRVAKP
jgi:polyisoprenoid-binding protein YceI